MMNLVQRWFIGSVSESEEEIGGVRNINWVWQDVEACSFVIVCFRD